MLWSLAVFVPVEIMRSGLPFKLSPACHAVPYNFLIFCSFDRIKGCSSPPGRQTDDTANRNANFHDQAPPLRDGYWFEPISN